MAIRHDAVVMSARPSGSTSGRGPAASLRQAAAVAGEALALAGVVLTLPLAILAIGIPIALFVQLLLWIARLL